MTRSHSASGISSKGWGLSVAKMAALLTSTSTRPKAVTAASTMAATEAATLTSVSHAEDPIGRAELFRGRDGVGDVGHHDLRALGEEPLRILKADARRPTRDHRDLVREPHVARA